MTHDAFTHLTPGPDADRMAAEAMGMPLNYVLHPDGPNGAPVAAVAEYVHVPHFSTSYDAAWTIVEFLRAKGWIVRVQEMPDGIPWLHNDKHEVHKRSVCVLYAMCVPDAKSDERRVSAYGDTSCMAIVRALLIWRALHHAG